MTLVSCESQQCSLLLVFSLELTLVLQEVAHPCPPRQDQLGDILHNLSFSLGRQCLEPLCEPDFP
jgi:hypothetical protein